MHLNSLDSSHLVKYPFLRSLTFNASSKYYVRDCFVNSEVTICFATFGVANTEKLPLDLIFTCFFSVNRSKSALILKRLYLRVGTLVIQCPVTTSETLQVILHRTLSALLLALLSSHAVVSNPLHVTLKDSVTAFFRTNKVLFTDSSHAEILATHLVSLVRNNKYLYQHTQLKIPYIQNVVHFWLM